MVDGQAGKGSRYRNVDRKKWDEGWENAFKKDLKKTNSPKKNSKQKEKKETDNE